MRYRLFIAGLLIAAIALLPKLGAQDKDKDKKSRRRPTSRLRCGR